MIMNKLLIKRQQQIELETTPDELISSLNKHLVFNLLCKHSQDMDLVENQELKS